MYARDRETPQLHQSSHRALSVGTPLQTYAHGRHCAHPDCSSRLSRYNPSDTCAVHSGWRDTRQRSHA